MADLLVCQLLSAAMGSAGKISAPGSVLFVYLWA